jgi:hypothetical protein
MITDAQVRRLRQRRMEGKTQEAAAARLSGMNEALQTTEFTWLDGPVGMNSIWEARRMGMNSLGSRARFVCVLMVPLLCCAATSLASAADPPMDPPSHHTGDAGPQDPEHGSMGNVGAKLANPVSDMWSIQFNVQGPTWNDGDLNLGSPEMGGNVLFQPVMPIPLYGSGEDTWRLIVRPILPIVFAQPIPTCDTAGCDQFEDKGGLGDWDWELLFTAPSSFTRLPKNLILGVGTTVVFPTSTSDALGNQQFAMGPALVAGWKTGKFTAVTLTSYNFHIGDATTGRARHRMSAT